MQFGEGSVFMNRPNDMQEDPMVFKITKKQMRDKISSRHDFILIFRLERKSNELATTYPQSVT